MEDKKSAKRRRFDAEFKREAIKLARSPGYSQARAAASLGISVAAIQKWLRAEKQEGEDAFRGNGNRTAEAERIHELEKEVRELRMERDILKKAAAYFATSQR